MIMLFIESLNGIHGLQILSFTQTYVLTTDTPPPSLFPMIDKTSHC